MDSAAVAGHQEFVVVSHNFELLKPNSSQPDPIVVKRFENLCCYLGKNRLRLPTAVYSDCSVGNQSMISAQPRSGFGATFARHVEQLYRRF